MNEAQLGELACGRAADDLGAVGGLAGRRSAARRSRWGETNKNPNLGFSPFEPGGRARGLGGREAGILFFETPLAVTVLMMVGLPRPCSRLLARACSVIGRTVS